MHGKTLPPAGISALNLGSYPASKQYCIANNIVLLNFMNSANE